jgi:hypothetical protein
MQVSRDVCTQGRRSSCWAHKDDDGLDSGKWQRIAAVEGRGWSGVCNGNGNARALFGARWHTMTKTVAWSG